MVAGYWDHKMALDLPTAFESLEKIDYAVELWRSNDFSRNQRRWGDIGAYCEPASSGNLQGTNFAHWVLYKEQRVLANLLTKYAVGV